MVTQRADLSNRASFIPGAEASARQNSSEKVSGNALNKDSDQNTLTGSFQSFFANGNQKMNLRDRTQSSVANLKSGYNQKEEYDKINSGYSKQADRMNKTQTTRDSQTNGISRDSSRDYSKEELDKIKEDIYSVVKDSTGMTDEEIDEALETMDISAFQLLQPEILKEFLMNQSGTEPVDMLTNPDLIQALQDMQLGMQEILESQDLNLSEEDTSSLIRMLEAEDALLSQNSDALNGMGELSQDMNDSMIRQDAVDTQMNNGYGQIGDEPASDPIDVMNDQLEEDPVTGEHVQDSVVTVTDGYKVSEQADKNPDSSVDSADSNAVTGARTDVDAESGIQVSVRNFDNNHEQNPSNLMNQNPSFAGDIVNQLSQAVQETESVMTSYTSVLEQQDIVRQVVEQIRVWNSSDNSRMQVQLYPEHLGRIEIQVMLRNGTMTAQITAETEMAKAAIESQLQSLKEAFEQKNMQVNAIEVNVGTPDFHEDQQQDSMNQGTGSGRRRGGIGGFGVDSGVDSDEDVLGAERAEERLEAEGASVEFKA